MSHIGKPLTVDYSAANPALLDMAARFAVLCADLQRAEADLRAACEQVMHCGGDGPFTPSDRPLWSRELLEQFGITQYGHRPPMATLRLHVINSLRNALKGDGDVAETLKSGLTLLDMYRLLQRRMKATRERLGIPQLIEKRDAILGQIGAAMAEIVLVTPASMADTVVLLQIWQMRYGVERIGAETPMGRQAVLISNAIGFLSGGAA